MGIVKGRGEEEIDLYMVEIMHMRRTW